MRYVFLEGEQDSIAARLMELYTLPAQIFKIPVPEGHINVKMRLLSDQENLDVAKSADSSGPLSRIIIQRKQILARAIQGIEDGFIEMPASLKQDIRDRTGREVTDIEEKVWVLERCQPAILQALMECYEEMINDQASQVAELKKKFEESQAATPPETT